MKTEERVWWSALADQYEAWAENPPRDQFGYEQHTCNALRKSECGWRRSSPSASDGLPMLWFWQYGNTEFPAGHSDFSKYNRPEKRFEFCWYIAETIRDFLEEGRGPWE